MILSDALPVQFWLNGIPTFNEKDEAGIEKNCFFQLFNAEDEITIQLTAEASDEYESYRLLIFDEDDELLERINLDQVTTDVWSTTFTLESYGITSQLIRFKIIGVFSGLINSDFETDVTGSGTPSGWELFGSNNAWDTQNDPFLGTDKSATSNTIGGGGSKYLRQLYDKINEGYRLIISSEVVSKLTTPGTVTIQFVLFDSDTETELGTLTFSGNNETQTFELTIEELQQDYTSFGFRLQDPIDAGEFEIFVHQVSFELEVELAKSDLVDIQETHIDTRTIEYTNTNDYAGLIYDIDYPPTFILRIESKFYEPELPQEIESEDDGAGSVTFLSGSVKEQKLLEIEPIPPYMLKKLALIFKHNSTWLENYAWTAEEELKKKKLNDKFAFFTGEITLTKKDNSYLPNVN